MHLVRRERHQTVCGLPPIMFIFDWLSQAVAILILIWDVMPRNFIPGTTSLSSPVTLADGPHDLRARLRHEGSSQQRRALRASEILDGRRSDDIFPTRYNANTTKEIRRFASRTIWRCSMFIVDWLRQAIAILILIGDVIYLNFGRRTGGLPPPAAPAREPADRLEHDRRARQRFPNRLPIIIITTYGEIGELLEI